MLKKLIIILLIFIILAEIEYYSEINFNKILYPKYYNLILHFDKNFPECYHKDVIKGKEIARDKKIVICGLARNIEKNLDNTFERFKIIGSYFKDYIIVCFENDSNDNTREKIKNYDKTIVIDCSKYGSYDCKLNIKHGYNFGWYNNQRLSKMAFYREQYLDYIKNNLSDYDYVLVIDFDLDGGFCIDGLLTSLLVKDFGAIYGNSQNSFYGLFGSITFTYDSLAYIDINDDYPEDPNYFTNYKMLKNTVIQNIKCGYFNGYVPVKSAFNGWGLYNMKAFINSSYIGLPFCEHINLAKKINELGYKQLINCSWYGYHSITGNGGILKILTEK